MERRDFLRAAGLGLGAATLSIPIIGTPVKAFTPDTLDASDKKKLADVALNAATAKGATYVDVRIGKYVRQFLFTREKQVRNTVNTESAGVGIRVIANGTWGFSATHDMTPASVTLAAEQAVAIAKANSVLQTEPVNLAPARKVGEVNWSTPIERNPFDVPLSEKVDLLMRVNQAALDAGATYVNSALFLINEKKYFASTDGNYIDQDIYRIFPNFDVTAIDKSTGKFRSRQSLSCPMGMGYEYLDGRKEGLINGPAFPLYGKYYDMVADAAVAAKQAQEKLTAKSVEPGKYDLVLDPNHLFLTIHESVGHPLELDRVLGYEANFAGTSFCTLDKWKSKNFKFGSDIVTLFADRTQDGSLGRVGYDDEGVEAKRWNLVKDGILVNYQAIRDQVHILGEKESHGCCYADSWSSVQFQRMPNVSLAPGKEPYSVDEMIKDVEKGIYIVGRGSYSIDQQRYNFQFGGTVFYEIKDGKIVGMLEDVAYTANTQEFWNACTKICDERDYRLGGSLFDGKGEPTQVSAVSHGSSTARFNGINVINTARKV